MKFAQAHVLHSVLRGVNERLCGERWAPEDSVNDRNMDGIEASWGSAVERLDVDIDALGLPVEMAGIEE
ncbi:hypothetical protein QF046_002971 [Microbacterium sp. W4I4]|uniref:hypothetical protein n=1 Tax=Microbacterium sp. W4I4 TaxID=3042295 RepID=UPI00278AC59B|nr:hypothetical protein [Microbacterium sp. W4I4]MDQ0615330.1 hypothetical protein [Microbacterium sp. W4I4]